MSLELDDAQRSSPLSKRGDRRGDSTRERPYDRPWDPMRQLRIGAERKLEACRFPDPGAFGFAFSWFTPLDPPLKGG